MKVIGITGGVGAGKSCVLDFLEKNYNCVIVKADDLAKSLYNKGESCYRPLIKLLSRDVLNDEGAIDFKKMASMIYTDESLRLKVNAIVHPRVKKAVLKDIKKYGREGKYDYYFLEAALLIEDNYRAIVDEIWYIYTDESVRRERLKASRGYSDEKIDGILKSQLSEAEYREGSDFTIDNSGTEEATFIQIRERMNRA